MRVAHERFENSAPVWAKRGALFTLLICVMALLEEAVFRAIGLGGMWHIFGLPKIFAAGISALFFGLSHFYYGWRQIIVKAIDGAILVWIALSSGWVMAAVVHILLNIILVSLSDKIEKDLP